LQALALNVLGVFIKNCGKQTCQWAPLLTDAFCYSFYSSKGPL